ncbi:MAG: HD domain-containing phosphohydrolase [Thermodesulforhabdaceae bacterium]
MVQKIFKVLFVDDEPSVLLAMKRAFYKIQNIKIDTAESGKEGIEKIKKNGPYALVISDLRMPVMDGIQFLTRVKELSPDTVRIMLTGYADIQTAIEAINSGNVFRFLTKPCSSDTLLQAVAAGVEQYKLIKAEKELLENTLKGCVKTLMEVLSLSNPEAFGRASRVTRYALWIGRELQYQPMWKLETAARLSQLGCFIVPEEAFIKMYRGEKLQGEEKQLMEMHPSIAADLIRYIPRLEEIAEIITYQEKHYDGTGLPIDSVKEEEIPIESRILKIALDFDLFLYRNHKPYEAYEIMSKRSGVYDPKILPVLRKIVHIQSEYEPALVKIEELKEGMIISEDLFTVDGRLLIRQGHEVSAPLIEKLKNFAKTIGVEEPIKVLRPRS